MNTKQNDENQKNIDLTNPKSIMWGENLAYKIKAEIRKMIIKTLSIIATVISIIILFFSLIGIDSFNKELHRTKRELKDSAQHQIKYEIDKVKNNFVAEIQTMTEKFEVYKLNVEVESKLIEEHLKILKQKRSEFGILEEEVNSSYFKVKKSLNNIKELNKQTNDLVLLQDKMGIQLAKHQKDIRTINKEFKTHFNKLRIVNVKGPTQFIIDKCNKSPVLSFEIMGENFDSKQRIYVFTILSSSGIWKSNNIMPLIIGKYDFSSSFQEYNSERKILLKDIASSKMQIIDFTLPGEYDKIKNSFKTFTDIQSFMTKDLNCKCINVRFHFIVKKSDEEIVGSDMEAINIYYKDLQLNH